MAYSKAFLLFGLALAVVLLISSEVSADDAAQTGNVNEVNYDGRFGGRWSCMTGRDHTGSDMPRHGRTGSDMPETGRTGTDMPVEDMAAQR